MSEIKIPRVNTNEDEVEIVHWYVEDGTLVQEGADLVDIGTSKATMTLAAESSGYVQQRARKGDMKGVGYVIARIHQTQVPAEDSAPVRTPDREAGITSINTSESGNFTGTRFSAAAIQYLKDHSISEARFQNQGLVTIDTIRESLGLSPKKHAPCMPAVLSPPPVQNDLGIRREPVLRAKKLEIANLLRGQEGGINSTLSNQFQSQLIRRKFEQEKIFGGALLPVIIFEVARLLKERPNLNAYFESDQWNLYERVHVGVALDVGNGLKVVVLRDADQLWPSAIYERLTEFGRQDLENRLDPSDLEGSTFTISDLSAAGILNFVPLINGRQSAILGIGGDTSLPGSPMTLSVTFDHRVLSGREVADFLSCLRERIVSYGKATLNANQANHAEARSLCCDFCLVNLESYYAQFQNAAILLNYLRRDGTTGHVCHVCVQGY